MSHTTRALFAVASLCAAIFVSGCGGGNDNASSAPSPTATTEAQREQAALPLTQAAPIPSDLHCKSDIVWVNMGTKAYHEPADPYYGRTKNGKYMCKAAADAAGYHKAGSHH